MKITLLQQDIAWAAPEKNRKTAEAAIFAAGESDLYVLPEMWSTGFAMEPDGVAERDETSLNWMKKTADTMQAAIAGSISTEADGRFYNRFYFVKPSRNGMDNEVHYYDKRHLFTYSGEHMRYSAGNERVIVEWKGVRFLLQVCYDLRFPVFSRNMEDYDAVLYVASWPKSRRSVWDILLKARAIENQCFVCGVNRVGTDEACEYNGGTMLIDARGKTVAACNDCETGAITVELDMENLAKFREKFPVLKDRDKDF